MDMLDSLRWVFGSVSGGGDDRCLRMEGRVLDSEDDAGDDGICSSAIFPVNDSQMWSHIDGGRFIELRFYG